MSFCSSCGQASAAPSRYCGHCGAVLPPAAVTAPAPMAPPAEPGPFYPPPPPAPLPYLPVYARPTLPARMRALGNWTAALLAGVAGFSLVLAVAAAAQWAAWRTYLAAPAGSFEESQALDDWAAAEDLYDLILGLTVLGGLVIGVLIIVWLLRAAKNAEAFGATGILSPSWAVGGWFIPFANLVMPAIVAAQAWRAADPSSPHPVGPAWRRSRIPGVLMAWWVCWVLASLTFMAGSVAYPAEDFGGSYDIAYGFWLVQPVLLGLAAGLGALTVRGLSRRHDARIDAVAANLRPAPYGGFPPPPFPQPPVPPPVPLTYS